MDNVTFRSRFPSYRFGGSPATGGAVLEFSDHIAVTADAKLIAAAKADTRFGEGGDFWIDPAQPKEAEKPPKGGAKPVRSDRPNGAAKDPANGGGATPPKK